MLSTAVALALVVFVFTSPFVVMAVVARGRRVRAEEVARQIAVTDAIHREVGPVVAPVVTRRGRHAWTVAMAVPQDAHLPVGRILGLAYETLAGDPRTGRTEVACVLRPPAGGRRNLARVRGGSDVP